MTAFLYTDVLEAGPLRQLLAPWRQAFPAGGVLALFPESESGKLAELQEACRDLGLPLAGAIFPALVKDTDFVDRGAWLLRLDEMPPHGLIPDVNAPGAKASDRIASAVLPHIGREALELFMLFDVRVPNISSILDDLYLELADRVRYGGANAGSESFQPMPCVFDEKSAAGDGLLWMLLPAGRGTFLLEHGYAVPDYSLQATSTEGNRIIAIDWQPAFQVYQELVSAHYGVKLTPDNFYRYATHFPFGILRAAGEAVVRIPIALEEDGSILCAGEIPPNSLLVVLQAPGADSLHATAQMARSAAPHRGAAERNLLAFYCAGRRMHLGDGARAELADLASRSGAASMAGALSLGEIGNRAAWGYPLFHNACFVCSLWDAT